MVVSIRVKVTVPKEKFADVRVQDEILRVMRMKTTPDLKREFNLTTATWNLKPSFQSKQEHRGDRISTEVYTNDDIYRLVNEGSPKHPIPRAPGFIRYRTGYKSKTRPGWVNSFTGGKFGGWRVARQIQHPGFEARRFDEMISSSYKPTFEIDMQQAINRAFKRNPV